MKTFARLAWSISGLFGGSVISVVVVGVEQPLISLGCALVGAVAMFCIGELICYYDRARGWHRLPPRTYFVNPTTGAVIPAGQLVPAGEIEILGSSVSREAKFQASLSRLSGGQRGNLANVQPAKTESDFGNELNEPAFWKADEVPCDPVQRPKSAEQIRIRLQRIFELVAKRDLTEHR